MKDRTILVVAHDPGLISNADLIIALQEGKIAEEGAHEQLMEKEGIYYRLWNKQADRVKRVKR
jgi:ABC-type multidrug transport system fused ATPase/permease subunit